MTAGNSFGNEPRSIQSLDDTLATDSRQAAALAMLPRSRGEFPVARPAEWKCRDRGDKRERHQLLLRRWQSLRLPYPPSVTTSGSAGTSTANMVSATTFPTPVSRTLGIAAAATLFLASGAKTLTAIAAYLNAHGVPSREGKLWHPSSVSRTVRRISEAAKREALQR